MLCYLDCLRLDRVPLMRRTLRMARRPGWTTYANHRTAAQCSDPNFATILTGGSPDTHRVYTQMGARFVKEFNTLQKRLKRAGYSTWSYQPILVPRFYTSGFDQIIDHHTHEVSPTMAPGVKRTLKEAIDEPWFGFMRVMDTHYPYNGEPLPEERDGIPAQYDKAVHHVDKFVSHLARWVIKEYPDTLVVIGSDHGEMLGDYGGLWDHLFSLRDALTRVPLFVYDPRTEGGMVSGRTQHQMVTGMALSAAGLADAPEPVPGPTWLSCWGTSNRDEWKHRALVVDDDQGREWKYTVNWTTIPDDDPTFELHLDGDEGVNYFGDNDISRELAGWIEQEHPTAPRAFGGAYANGARQVDLPRAPRGSAEPVPLGGA